MNLPKGKQRQDLLPLLRTLNKAVEEILLAGLAAVSEKSRQTLTVSFQTASRNKLLRLGSTIRVAVEELSRFARNDPLFSRRRFGFFLNRAWMLSHGMLHALEKDDAARWRQLIFQGAAKEAAPVEALKVVTMGVMKRVVPNAFVAFEFRMRVVGDSAALAAGTPLTWSHIFPIQAKADVPPEAYLHLPLPQKFKAADFLQGRAVTVGPVAVSADGRLSLPPQASIEIDSGDFDRWGDFLHWDKAAALARLRSYEPGPFDLEMEMQEEVVLHDWKLLDPLDIPRENQQQFPFQSEGRHYFCPVGLDDAQRPLRERLLKLKKARKKPPVYGIAHYEMCRFMFQPLTLFADDGPEPLMLSKEKFDPAALVRALKFT